jgi:hypothetical protein
MRPIVEGLSSVARAIERRLQGVAPSGCWRVVPRTTLDTIFGA